MTANESNQPTNVVNQVYNNTYNNTLTDRTIQLFVFTFSLQCVMILLNSYFKLALELPQLWYPTFMAFLLIVLPLIKMSMK